MNKKILYALYGLTGTTLAAAVIAPIAVEVPLKTAIKNINATIFKSMKLTIQGQEYFNGILDRSIAGMQQDVDQTENFSNWVNFFEGVDGNGDAIPLTQETAFVSVADVTIVADESLPNDVTKYQANLSLKWNDENINVSSDIISNAAVALNLVVKEVQYTYATDVSAIGETITDLITTTADASTLTNELNNLGQANKTALLTQLLSLNQDDEETDKAYAIQGYTATATAGTGDSLYNIKFELNPNTGYEIVDPIIELKDVLVPGVVTPEPPPNPKTK